MALSTYAELKTAITDFSHRSDLGTQHDTFIRMAEEAIYNGLGRVAPLRISAMQANVTTGLPSLPSDFLEAIRLTSSVGTETTVLDYRPPNLFAKYSISGGPGLFFTILNQQIVTQPNISAGSYTLHYYKRFLALDGTNTTNYILTNAPTVYLHGCMMALYQMTYDDAREERATQRFAAAMAAFQTKERAGLRSGSTLEIVAG
jgi:hypothetical protein